MRTLAVIPARYGSTRFPGKPLVLVGGVPMIVRVWQRAQEAQAAGVISDACVATDDERIFATCQAAGATVWMTRSDHPSGTDRLLEVAQHYPGMDAFLNVQGDEPFLAPAQLAEVMAPLHQRAGTAAISTLAQTIRSAAELHNPNAVKVVVADDGRALYFSRHPLPYQRNEADPAAWVQAFAYRKHVGLYGFTAAALQQIAGLRPHPLELAESLEQLRWLAAGLPVYVAETDIHTPAIDTPADLAHVEALLAAGELR